MDEKSTMLPRRRALIRRPAARITLKLPLRLRPTTRSKSSSSYATISLRTLMLGVQITTSRPSRRVAISVNAAPTATPSRMSSVSASAWDPVSTRCAAVARAPSPSMSRQCTAAPGRASPRATASPIPEAAPITAATRPPRPNSRGSSVVLMEGSWGCGAASRVRRRPRCSRSPRRPARSSRG